MPLRRFLIGSFFVVGVVGSIATSSLETYSCNAQELDDECRAGCEAVLARYTTPRRHIAALNGVCLVDASAADGDGHCGCFVSAPGADAALGDNDVLIGAVVDIFGEPLAPVEGRCALGDDAGCSSLCESLETARVADDARTDASLFGDRCDAGCACTLDVEGRCGTVRLEVGDNSIIGVRDPADPFQPPFAPGFREGACVAEDAE